MREEELEVPLPQGGVTLNASCLMQPLKSVSGVLVAGERDIHDFVQDYDFCDVCTTHHCRLRITSLAAGGAASEAKEEHRWRS